MNNYFFVRSGNKYVRIRFAAIIYVEALKNYIRIVTDKETYQVLIRMKRIETELPAEYFCRVHRSFIIALERIVCFDSEKVRLDKKTISLAPHYKEQFFQRINIVQQERQESEIPDDALILS